VSTFVLRTSEEEKVPGDSGKFNIFPAQAEKEKAVGRKRGMISSKKTFLRLIKRPEGIRLMVNSYLTSGIRRNGKVSSSPRKMTLPPEINKEGA